MDGRHNITKIIVDEIPQDSASFPAGFAFKLRSSETTITESIDLLFPYPEILIDDPAFYSSAKPLGRLWFGTDQCIEIVGGSENPQIIKGVAVTPISIAAGDRFELINKTFHGVFLAVSGTTQRSETRACQQAANKLEEDFARRGIALSLHRETIDGDARNLHQYLQQYRKSDADFVITVGGIALGDNNITQPVIEKALEYRLHAVEAHIYARCGVRDPNLTLYRPSIGVADKQVIFSIPGDLEAASIYIEEIAHILPQTLYRLNNTEIVH